VAQKGDVIIGFFYLSLCLIIHHQRTDIGVIGKLVEVVGDAGLTQQTKNLRNCLTVGNRRRRSAFSARNLFIRTFARMNVAKAIPSAISFKRA
jgi:hypothetical protein